MTSSLVALMLLSLFLGFCCWLVFLWAVKRGEFSDIERPKHRMLEEDEQNQSQKHLTGIKTDKRDNQQKILV